MTDMPTSRPRMSQPAPTPWKLPPGSGFREVGLSSLVAFVISSLIIAPGARMMYREHTERQAAERAYEERLASHARLMAAPAGEVFAVGPILHGKGLFEGTCASCHNVNGTGMPRLGKDLTASWFVASLDDNALREFIGAGRPADDSLNTTRVAMPPKGGRADLTDADLRDIVAYVRCLQDPRRKPEIPAEALAAAAAAASAATAPSQDEKAAALAAAGGDEELAGYIAHGTKVFAATCAACHGKDGHGLPKLGKDLVTSVFIKGLDDDGMLAFVKRGRDPGDPLNTSGVAMPPKGGNPALSDDDLLDVIAYVRSLQRVPTTQ